MQLFAMDEKDQIVNVIQASKKNDYFCLECQKIVRKRGGFLKKDHFYHLEQERFCRQNGKSLEHLHVQQHLQTIFPLAVMEKRFSEINRIADVCVDDLKLIFEVQCSPISAKEIDERNLDYQSLGYQVVWILHDKQYNKKNLSSAEYFLLACPHYFTNFNENGEGFFYDQLDFILKGQRFSLLRTTLFSLGNPQLLKGSLSKNFLSESSLRKRFIWPIYFPDDLVDKIGKMNPAELKELIDARRLKHSELKENIDKTIYQKKKLNIYLKLPFRILLNYYLETLTRN